MHKERFAALLSIALVLGLLCSGTVFTFASSGFQSSSQNGNQTKDSQELKYRLAGNGTNPGQGEANIQIQHTSLNMDIEIEHAAKTTTYSVILIAISTGSGGTGFGTSGVGGTSVMGGTSGVSTTTTTSNACANPIGQLVTSKEGEGIAHLETSLPAGTYQIGIILCIGDSPAIVSHPTTQEGIITQSNGNDIKSTLKNDAQHIISIIRGANENGQIHTAKHDGKFVVVVDGGHGHSPRFSDVNSDYSAGVGVLGSSGLIVSLSSTNSGPGAILVNLGNVPMASVLTGIAVTFDGALVTSVSSVSQVLNSPAGQSSYALVQTSSGLALLMFLPNVADDIIQIMPVFSYNWVFISIAAFASIAAVGAVVLMYRKNYLPIPVFH